MDASALKALIALLREQGVTYYKTPELELQLAPMATFPSSPAVGEPEAAMPEILKKLNPNYSHPSLLKVTNTKRG